MTISGNSDCTGLLSLVIVTTSTLKEVQAHVKTCQSCGYELQEVFEDYQQRSVEDDSDLPPGIESIEAYLTNWVLYERQNRQRMDYVWTRLMTRVSKYEVLSILVKLFSDQLKMLELANSPILPKGRARDTLLTIRLRIMNRGYVGLQNALDSDLFSFLMSGNADKDGGEIMEIVQSAWKGLCDLGEESES